MATITVDVYLEDFDDSDLVEECRSRGLNVLPTAPADVPSAELVVERAYLAARTMTELPQELKDLFWIVHSRAIA